jgi:toxin FitB
MYLLDTNVISVLSPTRSDNSELKRWLAKAGDRLFLSAITASEVIAGIEKARRQGHETKARRLQLWWDAIEYAYRTRILPVDLDVARIAGAMIDQSHAFEIGYEDIAIAATAQHHRLCVLTANTRHFRPLGVRWHNPLESLPALP